MMGIHKHEKLKCELGYIKNKYSPQTFYNKQR